MCTKQSNNGKRFHSGHIATVLALLLALAPQAFAAKPVKPCVPNEKKGITCEPVLNIENGSDIQIGLGGNQFWEDAPYSTCAMGPSTNLSGTYNCPTAGRTIYLSVHAFGEPVASSKRHADVCNSLVAVYNPVINDYQHLGFSPDSYSVHWTENCAAGACAVEMRFVLTDMVNTLTTFRSDRVEFYLYADADVPDATLNPFEENLDLGVYAIEADFKKPGSLRTLVTCHWSLPDADWVSIESTPLP